MTHRRTWQMVRAVLAAVLFVPASMLLTPTAALACSCASADVEVLIGYVDTVAVGELTAVDSPSAHADGSVSSNDRVTYAATLQEVFMGDPGNPMTFRSGSNGASCGLEGMRVGQDYVFFVRDGESTLCDGTAPATERLIAEVEAVTGPGQPVVAAESDPAPESDPPPVAESPSAEHGSAAAWFLWPALGVGAVSLLFVGWLVWHRSTD